MVEKLLAKVWRRSRAGGCCMQLARVRPWQVHVRGDIASLRNISKQKQRVGRQM